MTMLKKLAIVHVLLFMSCAAIANDDIELITFVLTQNAEAANRMSSLSYKCKYECDMDLGDPHAPVGSTGANVGDRQVPRISSGPPRGGRTHAEGVEEVIQKGSLRWTSKQEHKTWDAGGGQDFHARTAINNDYAAMWNVGQSHAYQFDHESIPSISPKAARRLTLSSSRDCMRYTLDQSFLQQYMETKDTKRWEIEEKILADSSSLFYIKEYFGSGTPSDSNHLRRVLVIDPVKDFLVTRSTYYRPDGTIALKTDVTLEKSENANIWLPKAIDEKRYYPASSKHSSGNDVMKWLRMNVTDVLVNPEVDDRQFTLEALEIPDGVKLVKRLTGGFESILVKRNGDFEMKSIEDLIDRIETIPTKNTEIEVATDTEKAERSTSRQVTSSGAGQDRPNKASPVKSVVGHGKVAGWIAYYVIALAVILAITFLCAILYRREKRKEVDID
ncbi:MAG: outer membrane lipoprotein-sorting protein [Planctomycetes bacterium]|nr:outer membrane lipoprotein-sorting protein [Planctomycetota bacterium]